MCKDCGCSGHHHDHDAHDHGHHHHDHGHDHDHGHWHSHDGGKTFHSHDSAPAAPAVKKVPLAKAVLADNDADAAANRQWFAERGITSYNLISSTGSGKTALLVETLKKLDIPAAVIVGDPYGEYDADRLRATGAPVTQIQVHESCHLSARQVGEVLESAIPAGTKIVFIENVGNLVCPVAFDLGEQAKVALLSTPEGEEKPLKYPALFAAADIALLTKADLADALGCDMDLMEKNIRRIRPDAAILRVSSRTGNGMDKWIEQLKKTNQNKEGVL